MVLTDGNGTLQNEIIVVLGEALSRAWIMKKYDSKMRFENINEWELLKDEISENMKQNLKSNQSYCLQISTL